MKWRAKMSGWLSRLPAPGPWQVALIIFLVHGSYVVVAGPTTGQDSATYARLAQQLVESGFDYAGQLAQVNPEFPAILYVLFVTLVALLQLAFGSAWQFALIALNLGADVGVGLIILRLVGRSTSSNAARWAALLLFLGCFDLFQWVRYALSDSTFVFIAFAIFALVAARILGDSRGWMAVIGLAGAGIFYRPTGIVLVPDLAWAAYLARVGRLPIHRGRLVLGFGAAAVSAAGLFAWLMQDPQRWPFAILARAFEVTASGYLAGAVVDARFETYHAPPSDLIDYVLISGDRFIHFFAPGAADFSATHWVAQLIFFVPCYAFAAWLLVALWRSDTGFGDSERKLFFASAGAVLAYATFHGLVQVDFDWRYRSPILPHLILLAAGGIADIERRFRLR
ncbi:MAG TPA: hypothetical protein VFO69_08180 [Allosphingosinicella sp.]|nr:hypothetical protein [Allosphingosinicella sp.]